jgi:hypothetical protein
MHWSCCRLSCICLMSHLFHRVVLMFEYDVRIISVAA